MQNKSAFYTALTEEQQVAGHIKFNIPDPGDGMKGLNGEGVWGWISPEDKEKWANNEFTGKIKAILLNDPLRFAGQLACGTEVVIKCNGPYRPTLDVDWAKENLVFPKAEEARTYRFRLGNGESFNVVATSQYDAVREAMVRSDTSHISLDSFEAIAP